jgi:hypothetical protein
VELDDLQYKEKKAQDSFEKVAKRILEVSSSSQQEICVMHRYGRGEQLPNLTNRTNMCIL